ncbi:MAG: helix-hairpin-helix domain-containing protein [Rubrivivax sp.]|nr:helix-hairpin-helix domain-containing protein [Rubrivivax sp.]MDP3613872.1 helix-hairpin-helix domain-containing protein [Rubrivivax sp.]
MIRNFIALLMAVFALNAFAAADVNQATQAELESVKGIGPGLSAKILQARQSGNFKNWDDLVDRVGGIGPGNAARFSQAGLTVGGAAYDGKPVEAKATKTSRAPKADAKDKAEPKAGKAKTDKTGA